MAGVSGIIVIDKPSEWTSHDVVAKLRGVLGERRTGHSGTLDPMATGVLPVFVGRATRAVQFMDSADKEYLASIRFGLTTDTQDIWGTVLMESKLRPDESAVKAVLEEFTGEIEQLPPMYSAVKVNGKKLYEYARAGREVERESRKITIYSIKPEFGKGDVILRIRCSKGAYVRTICHDIGQSLGCGAVMSGLRRTAAGIYTDLDALTLEQVINAENPRALLRPVDSLFAEYPAVQVGAYEQKCRNGTEYPFEGEGLYRVYSEDEFLMLGRAENGKMQTVKSFFEVK